jgi:putative nucleotidyltransferase with HDIG domain
MIGQEMELTEEEMLVLERAAQLHDIGKLVLDTSYIERAGPLTLEEWAKVRQHPVVGANIIRHLGFLEREGDIIRSHHERLDGRGYPFGRHGEELDLLAKIVSVADSFDAMTSMRSYRDNMGKQEAIAELCRCCRTQFDPAVVEVFTSILEAIKVETLPME